MDKELKSLLREVLTANIDVLAHKIAQEIKITRARKVIMVADKGTKMHFVKEYLFLCKEAFKFGGNRSHAKEPAGRCLVEMARKELGYKSTTVSGDIFHSIYRHYCELVGITKDYAR